jgi:hypothetical protein
MRILLDKAAELIARETDPLHRANGLGAIGKMEFVYFSKENAQKYFDEALEILKTVKIDPNSSAVASQLPAFFLELGEKEKAQEAVKIALFGNGSEEEIDPRQPVFEWQYVLPLEMLAKTGDAELAYEVFLQSYNRHSNKFVMSKQLATLQIIALYHDSQNPDNPMLPKAKEQYQKLFSEQIREVNNKKDGYEKESVLRNVLLGWVTSEKRIQAVQSELENQAETPGIAEQHIQRRQLGYGNSLNEFGNPFYRAPVIQL